MHLPHTPTIGWDIGGVHTKAVRCTPEGRLTARTRAFAIEHMHPKLGELLREMSAALGAEAGDRHAVTMTAELSQVFRTKREGVECVLRAVAESLGEGTMVFSVTGEWLSITEALRKPLAAAASNWAATARLVALRHPDSLLVDIGSTTTDLIPIVGGQVNASGLNDPERLASGELLYTGVVRTPVEAIVRALPWQGRATAVSAEGFAIVGDAYLWLGELDIEDYTTPTPDGRPATRGFAGERLARTICADREMLAVEEIDALARAIAEAQAATVAEGMRRVLARHPTIRQAVVSGQGSFLAARAAERVGLEAVRLADYLGEDAARIAPAAAAAILASRVPLPDRVPARPAATPQADPLIVVKVGGGISRSPLALTRVGRILSGISATHRLVVVPGGGPFADAVRGFDATVGLGPDAAHWMAILGMDQFAHALADGIPGAELIESPSEIAGVHARGAIPVLAPSRWLRSADELPHAWSVTSDSLSAYLAGLMGAGKLVLIKPVSGGAELLDPYFSRALPDGIRWWCLGVDQVDQLENLLGQNGGSGSSE